MHEDTYFEFVIPSNQGKERLDKFLTRAIAHVSRARLQKLIEEGRVILNGKPAKASHLITPHEKIEVCIPRPEKIDILPEPIPLDIRYEDQHLLVVNKPAGLVVHPAFANYTGTLVNALLHHCGDLSGIGGKQRPGIVHRLDKDTSGLIVIAKDDQTHRDLSRQFAEKTTVREYHCIAWGNFRKRTGAVETRIARSPKDRKRMTVQPVGKVAITNYQVLEAFKVLSYVKLTLETGRTHQIRVHLSYMGHPVFGDPTYGGRNRQLGGLANKERQFASELLQMMPRQALHARTLGFVHPILNRRMLFEAELPEDMKLLLQALRSEN
ncbi:MAG: RluA family pseudouridine synthase [bacterium]